MDKEETIKFYRTFLVRFDMKYMSTFYALKGEYEAARFRRDIIPGGWEWISDGDYGDYFVEFDTKEFVSDEVLIEMQRKLQLLDDACAAMLQGTGAQHA